MAQPAKSEMSAEEQAKNQPQPSVQPTEPEDPSQGGEHHIGQREILHHNVQGKQAEQHPASVAAQHATGSFTDKNEQKK
jgi:hypothetical protein